MVRSGVDTSDDRVLKMIALATQKFIADISLDALGHMKRRMQAKSGSASAKKEKRMVLTARDLQLALGEHGVNSAMPPYYA